MTDARDPCAAVVYARDLTDAELFALVAIYSLPKSRKTRIFHESAIREHSVSKPLAQAGLRPEKVLATLVKKGFLDGGGPDKKFMATEMGNCVKENFRFRRNQLEVDGVPASLTRSIGYVTTLRAEVRRWCAEADPERGARIERRFGGSSSDEDE